jgi:steroid 5-alpha reductase family enzyme
MKEAERISLMSLPMVVLVGYLVALAGSQGGATLGGVPVFAIAVGLAFLIQWLVFIPSYIFQTEKFFDLTGGITYISVTILVLVSAQAWTRAPLLLAALVIIWAIRLGTFLFRRIHKAGKDDRFDEIKPSFIRFLNVWTMQGLWVTFTAAAALVAITTTYRKELDAFAVAGFLVWVFGFAFEVVADAQKSRFNADPRTRANSSKQDCGPARATPIISARSSCGSALRSSHCPSCKAGSGSH